MFGYITFTLQLVKTLSGKRIVDESYKYFFLDSPGQNLSYFWHLNPNTSIYWALCDSDATAWNGSCKQEGSSWGCFTEKCHELEELIILESVVINSLSDRPENCLFFIFSYSTTDINNGRSQTSRLICSACQQLTFSSSCWSFWQVISNSKFTGLWWNGYSISPSAEVHFGIK